jgi:hypothetical protein
MDGLNKPRPFRGYSTYPIALFNNILKMRKGSLANE